MTPSELVRLLPFLLRLGRDVYEAVKSGDRSRTVGEIFDGVPSDLSEIERLRAEALERLRG